MERLVSQAANVSAKKLEQDFAVAIRLKKMKERTLAVSVEKIIEKKKKYVQEAKSNLLPMLSTKNNQNSTGFGETRNIVLNHESASFRPKGVERLAYEDGINEHVHQT